MVLGTHQLSHGPGNCAASGAVLCARFTRCPLGPRGLPYTKGHGPQPQPSGCLPRHGQLGPASLEGPRSAQLQRDRRAARRGRGGREGGGPRPTAAEPQRRFHRVPKLEERVSRTSQNSRCSSSTQRQRRESGSPGLPGSGSGDPILYRGSGCRCVGSSSQRLGGGRHRWAAVATLRGGPGTQSCGLHVPCWLSVLSEDGRNCHQEGVGEGQGGTQAWRLRAWFGTRRAGQSGQQRLSTHGLGRAGGRSCSHMPMALAWQKPRSSPQGPSWPPSPLGATILTSPGAAG